MKAGASSLKPQNQMESLLRAGEAELTGTERCGDRLRPRRALSHPFAPHREDARKPLLPQSFGSASLGSLRKCERGHERSYCDQKTNRHGRRLGQEQGWAA